MNKPRYGYSLVECLVVITLVAFVLGSVTLTLNTLRRNDLKIRGQLEQENTVERLVSIWRDDVHRTTNATLDASHPEKPASVLRLTAGAKRRIEYSIAANEVLRIA